MSNEDNFADCKNDKMLDEVRTDDWEVDFYFAFTGSHGRLVGLAFDR